MSDTGENSLFSAYVTHVDSEGPFLKIYIQKQNHRPRVQAIQDCLLSMTEDLNDCERKPIAGSLKKDCSVLLKHKNTWYRGKTVAMNTATSYFIKLIDYGGIELTSLDDIRNLGAFEFSKMKNHILLSSPLATEILLSSIVCEENTWDADTMKVIRHYLLHQIVQCTEIFSCKNTFFATVWMHNTRVSEYLSELDPCFCYIEEDEQLHKAQEYFNKISLQIQFPLVCKELDDPFQDYIEEDISPGTEHEVAVLSGIISPKKFFLSLKSSDHNLSKMHDAMVLCASEKPKMLTTLAPGITCAVLRRFSIFRGCIINILVEKRQCEILLIDFGSNYTVNYDDIYELSEKYCKPKPIAKQFSLYEHETSLAPNPNIKHIFAHIVSGKCLKMIVMSTKLLHLPSCNLYLPDGTSVMDWLKPIHFYSLDLKCYTNYEIIISHVEKSDNLPWYFFVQLKHNLKDLKHLMSDIDSYCKTELSNIRLFENAAFLVKTKDHRFYRAFVNHTTETEANVTLVDYGESRLVSIDSTIAKICPPKIAMCLPSQAIKCRFFTSSFSKQKAVQFEEITKERIFTMVAKKHLSDGSLLVQILDTSKIPVVNIEEEILKLDTLGEPSFSSPVASVESVSNTNELCLIPEYLIQRSITFTTPGLPEYKTDSNLRGTKKISCAQSQHMGTVPKTTSTRPITNEVRKKRNGKRIRNGERWVRDIEIENLEKQKFIQENKSESNSSSFSSKIHPPVCNNVSQKFKKESPTQVSEKVQITPLLMEPGTTFSARLLAGDHCTVAHFWVLPSQNETVLKELKMQLEVAGREPQTKLVYNAQELEPGDACLVRANVDYKIRWNRGQVNQVEFDMLNVTLVDYGARADVIIPGEVKVMVPSMAQLPALAMCCELRGVTLPPGKNKWSTDDSANFINTIEVCENLRVEVISISSDCKHSVVLRNEMKNINEGFGANALALTACKNLPEIEIRIGNIWEACFAWFVTPSEFFLYKLDRQEKYSQLKDCLSEYHYKCSIFDIQAGTQVLVQCPDDPQFYRGLVIATKGEKAKVYRHDIGDVRVVEKNKLKVLPENLMAEPAFAIPCYLTHVIPVDGPEWPKGSEDIFKITQKHSKFICRVEGNFCQGRLPVSLVSFSGVSLAHSLVHHKLALYHSKPVTVEPGVHLKVYMVTINPENLQFYVHIDFQNESLDDMQEKLQLKCRHLEQLKAPYDKSQLVAARSTKDGNWYRAYILEILLNEVVKVHYVDYGNKEEVNTVVQLPHEFQNVQQHAVKCQLPVNPINVRDAYELIAALTLTDDLLTLKVIDKPFNNIFTCDLITEAGVSICDELVDKELAHPLMFEAYFSSYSSSSEFYLHDVKDEDLIHRITSSILDQELKTLVAPKVGTLCIAKFTEDEGWYRACVTSITNTSVHVQFIDYGNTAVATEFKKLPSYLASIPPLAIRCCLKTVPSDVVANLLHQMAYDGTVCYQVLTHHVTGDKIYTVSLFKGGFNLLNLLNGYAVEDDSNTYEISNLNKNIMPNTVSLDTVQSASQEKNYDSLSINNSPKIEEKEETIHIKKEEEKIILKNKAPLECITPTSSVFEAVIERISNADVTKKRVDDEVSENNASDSLTCSTSKIPISTSPYLRKNKRVSTPKPAVSPQSRVPILSKTPDVKSYRPVYKSIKSLATGIH